MNKFLGVNGFDNYTNVVFNRAIERASKDKCDRVYLVHFILELMENKQIKNDFEDKTNIELDTLNTEYEYSKEEGDYGYIEEEHTNTVNYISSEFRQLIQDATREAMLNSESINPMIAYRMIMFYEDSTVSKLIEQIDEEINIRELYETDETNMPVLMSAAVNLNDLARQNKLDPVEARDDVIDQVIEVLGRRQKSNPCLVGEAGVGKTAIIEGLAQRINAGNVPYYLKKHKIISVDISAIVGGTKFRGDFESKFNEILDEVSGQKNVVLFFDEMHTLLNAGSNYEGGTNAGNILKPALSKGDIKIIGATTNREWKKFVESDSAFVRRLQDINVKEPTVNEAIQMVKKVAKVYTEYHNAIIGDDVIVAAVKLSDRYITNRKLPDKAITVIDETCSRVKANTEGKKIITITEDDVRHTISKITQIEVRELDDKTSKALNNLSSKLKASVIGQDKAVDTVSKAIRRSRAGVKNPNKPIGTFLFVGPTGVGKTELAKQLAKQFSGDMKKLIRFDMSEFMEKHTVSKLIGSPPGYVGYGEGGQLTEAIKRNPYSVVLFDEIEKAHPDVFNIMLQIMDDGILTDGQGTTVDFKNTILIMTSNAGYGVEKVTSIGFNVADKKDRNTNEDDAIKALEKTFRLEFLNRLDKVIVFNALSEEDCKSIVGLMLDEVKDRLKDKDINLNYMDNVINSLVKTGFDKKFGARNIRRKIQDEVEDRIADMIIDSAVKQGDTLVLVEDDKGINVCVQENIKVMEECIY